MTSSKLFTAVYCWWQHMVWFIIGLMCAIFLNNYELLSILLISHDCATSNLYKWISAWRCYIMWNALYTNQTTLHYITTINVLWSILGLEWGRSCMDASFISTPYHEICALKYHVVLSTNRRIMSSSTACWP